MLFQLDQKSLAYAATTLGSSMMNSVFGYYYVKVFLNHYQVSQSWFNVAQVIYMIWNAVNDPLFGYIQDNFNYSWVRSRRHSILYGAPLYGLAFLVPWFPWAAPGSFLNGLHLIVTLCFFDALLTFVLLAQCALFAELSKKQEDRVKLVKYSQVASLIGSSSVFFCGYLSTNLENFFNFQAVCFVIAILGFLFMRYTGLHSKTEYDELDIVKATVSTNNDVDTGIDSSGLKQMFKQTLEIIRERDFLSFVLTNFCQVYHKAFLAGFSIIICDQMVSKDLVPPGVRSLFYGGLSVAPQIFVIIMMPAVRHFGYYRMVRCSLIMKVILGLTVWLLGRNSWYVMAFFLVDTVGAEAAFSLFNLSLSDIIDQDKERHNRRHPLSSMVFGTNALVTKPAMSVAPMITVAILNHYGYQSIKSGAVVDEFAIERLHNIMFNVAIATTTVLGILQLALWSRYQLRDSHETVTKYVEQD